MIVERLIEVRLDLVNIDDIYSADYEKTAIRILKEKYQNRCFKSCFILDILKIVRRSQISCKIASLDGTVYLDVMFLAKALLYEKNEVIHDCKIVQISQNGTMHAIIDHSSLQIKNTDLNIFKLHEKIPVIVDFVRYSVFTDSVSVSAKPFMPILPNLIAYRIVADEENNVQDLKDKKSILLKKLSELKKNNVRQYKFFKELIFPYKNYPFNSIKLKSIVDLDKVEINSDVFIPPQYLDEDKIYNIDFNIEDFEKTKITLLEIPKNEFIRKSLSENIKNLNILIGFIENYSTLEKFKKTAYMWKFYQISKFENP